MFCCNTGEAGCCISSSSSDVDVEDPFATGSKIVGVGICAGVGWRRLLGSLEQLGWRLADGFRDDLMGSMVMIFLTTKLRLSPVHETIDFATKFFLSKQAENQLLSEDNNISLQPKQMNNRSLNFSKKTVRK